MFSLAHFFFAAVTRFFTSALWQSPSVQRNTVWTRKMGWALAMNIHTSGMVLMWHAVDKNWSILLAKLTCTSSHNFLSKTPIQSEPPSDSSTKTQCADSQNGLGSCHEHPHFRNGVDVTCCAVVWNWFSLLAKPTRTSSNHFLSKTPIQSEPPSDSSIWSAHSSRPFVSGDLVIAICETKEFSSLVEKRCVKAFMTWTVQNGRVNLSLLMTPTHVAPCLKSKEQPWSHVAPCLVDQFSHPRDTWRSFAWMAVCHGWSKMLRLNQKMASEPSAL